MLNFNKTTNKSFRTTIIIQTIKVLFCVSALIVAFLFALNGRYIKIDGEYYFDKWTETIIIPQMRYESEEELELNTTEVLKLYSALINKGYSQSDLGNEEIFVSKMKSKKSRKELYDWISKRDDFRIGKYENYEKRLTRK